MFALYASIMAWRRLIIALLPWVVAPAAMAVSVDGAVFERSDEDFFGPPAPPPNEHAPTPKSEERTIDPSERVNV